MASYKLSELAEDDLRLIAIKTIEAWGHSQAEAYILLLHEALIKIANAPDIGKRRPELSDNARSFPIQKHMVYRNFYYLQESEYPIKIVTFCAIYTALLSVSFRFFFIEL